MSRRYCLLPAVVALLVLPVCIALAGWSPPQVLWQDDWADPHNLSMDNTGSHLVTLIPGYDENDNSRHLMTTEKVAGVWQPPVLLATNGIYSDDTFQLLPSNTRPMMSGDGKTIVYLGYSGTENRIYVTQRQDSSSVWDQPVALDTGLASHHRWLSLSTDGKTLGLSDYPFIFGVQHVYVMNRDDQGAWGRPAKVSLEPGGTGDAGGSFPSLSADGNHLTWIANARLAYSQRRGGIWSVPKTLTFNSWEEFEVLLPQMSGDGASISYWLVKKVPNPDNTGYIAVSEDIYLMRREGAKWAAPQKINDQPVTPTLGTIEAPVVGDYHATRLVFSREANDQDVIYGSSLQVSDWLGGDAWSEAMVVSAEGYGNYNRFPQMTPDGRYIAFDGGVRQSPVYVPYALWDITTDEQPHAPPRLFIDDFETANTSAWISVQQ